MRRPLRRSHWRLSRSSRSIFASISASSSLVAMPPRDALDIGRGRRRQCAERIRQKRQLIAPAFHRRRRRESATTTAVQPGTVRSPLRTSKSAAFADDPEFPGLEQNAVLIARAPASARCCGCGVPAAPNRHRRTIAYALDGPFCSTSHHHGFSRPESPCGSARCRASGASRRARAHRTFDRRRAAAQLSIDLRMIDHVVAMSTARRGLKIWRAIEMINP